MGLWLGTAINDHATVRRGMSNAATEHQVHLFSDEEVPVMPQIALPSLEAVVALNPCEAPPPVPVVTKVAPVREHQSLYLSAREFLYAVNAADGAARWCQQVQLIRTREAPHNPVVSSPPPPRMHFAMPRVVGDENSVVYVSIEGFGPEHTCAFAADDGTLRWWTPTDARVASMPFMDWAVPLVRDGVVYSGTYALNASDGTVLWRIPIDTLEEGSLALHALVDDTLYATTQRGIYAINVQDGQIRWRYQPDTLSMVSGPAVVSGSLLYSGTSAGFDRPQRGHMRGPRTAAGLPPPPAPVGNVGKSYFCALDVVTGTEVWRYPSGDDRYPRDRYVGAVVQHETIYVSAGDRTLYALEKGSGRLRWQRQFAGSAPYPATIANDVLYITADGLYALRSADGAVLWHQPLESGPAVSFYPLVALDGAVYVVRLDGRGRGVLYALDWRDGAKCWHTSYPLGGALLAVTQ
jgi:outer membrane protein assembly factor BamB